MFAGKISLELPLGVRMRGNTSPAVEKRLDRRAFLQRGSVLAVGAAVGMPLRDVVNVSGPVVEPMQSAPVGSRQRKRWSRGYSPYKTR